MIHSFLIKEFKKLYSSNCFCLIDIHINITSIITSQTHKDGGNCNFVIFLFLFSSYYFIHFTFSNFSENHEANYFIWKNLIKINSFEKKEEASVSFVAPIPFSSSENNFLTGRPRLSIYFSIPGSNLLTDWKLNSYSSNHGKYCTEMSWMYLQSFWLNLNVLTLRRCLSNVILPKAVFDFIFKIRIVV